MIALFIKLLQFGFHNLSYFGVNFELELCHFLVKIENEFIHLLLFFSELSNLEVLLSAFCPGSGELFLQFQKLLTPEIDLAICTGSALHLPDDVRWKLWSICFALPVETNRVLEEIVFSHGLPLFLQDAYQTVLLLMEIVINEAQKIIKIFLH